MKYLIVFSLILTVFGANGQAEFEEKIDGKSRFYFNADWEVIKNKDGAKYYREATQLGDGRYRIIDYYMGGKVQMFATGSNYMPWFSEMYQGIRYRLSSTGDTLEITNYNDSSFFDGLSVTFHDNGKRQIVGNYSRGLRTGIWLRYAEDGEIVERFGYDHNGKMDGEYLKYNEEGQLLFKGNYSAGEWDGLWQVYHENGMLNYEAQFQAGNYPDKVKYYHDNGSLEVEGSYQGKTRIGEWVYLDKTGKETNRMTYDNEGNETGTFISFDQDSVYFSSRSYRDGELDGPNFTKNIETGAMSYSSQYNAGALESYELFWPNGQLKDRTTNNLETGSIQTQYFDDVGKEVTKSKMTVLPIIQNDKQILGDITKALKSQEDLLPNDRGVYSIKIDELGEISEVEVLETFDEEVDQILVEKLKEVIKCNKGAYFDKPARFENELAVVFVDGQPQQIKAGVPYVSEYQSSIDGWVQVTDQSYFSITERMPRYPGGESSLFKYLGSETKYPAIAKDAGQSGIVYVQFVVERSGLISNPEILRGLSPYLDQEANEW